MVKGLGKMAIERGLVPTSRLVSELGVTKEAIFYYRDKNIIPFVQVGKRFYYDLNKVKLALEPKKRTFRKKRERVFKVD